MLKKVVLAVILLISLGVFSACATPEVELIELTFKELAEYDGLNGRKAYIAVDGDIYDVTNSSKWSNGFHNGYQAGQDLTSIIESISPHGKSVLKDIPLIGKIKESVIEDPLDEKPTDNEDEENNNPLQLTLEELAYFDGKDGKKAYIAVNGIIYDVSDSPHWPQGGHNGYQAGRDLSNAIAFVSPHGTSVLSSLPIVGELIKSGN